MELAGKRLLILGGNLEKEDIKRFAQKNRIELVAAGNNPSADYCKIADEYYNINSTDADAMLSFLSEKEIDGVYLGGNEVVINSATKYLASTDYACYCTNEQWQAIQNKGNFKKLCDDFGLPVARRYKRIDDVKECDFPVITKPVDGSGSRGFSVCRNTEELIRGYSIASEVSFDGEVLIEKFLPNKSVVVIYTFSDGKMYYSGMENKIPVHYKMQGSYVAGIHLFESKFADEFRSRFESKLANMFASIRIREGTIWMEVFRSGENYYFNEAGYRYSGSATSYPVNYFYGINQVYSDLTFALTGKSQLFGNDSLIPANVTQKKHYSILPVHMHSGNIVSIAGVPEIESMPSVVKVILKKHVGEYVKDTGTVDQVFCFIHFTFDSEDELRQMIEKIYDVLIVRNETNQNLIQNMLQLNSSDLYV